MNVYSWYIAVKDGEVYFVLFETNRNIGPRFRAVLTLS